MDKLKILNTLEKKMSNGDNKKSNISVQNLVILGAIIFLFILLFSRPSVNIDLSNNKATAGFSNKN